MTHDPTCKELDHPGRTCSDITRADPINHPPHYTQHPSGVECITITEHYNFNVGNAIKYLWRAGLKDGTDAASDLRKAAWYVRREIERVAVPIDPNPDFPPVETQAQVAAAYVDRYSGQTRPDTDAVTDSIYGDHITDHNANDLPWGTTHNHLNARINALLIHGHSGARHAD